MYRMANLRLPSYERQALQVSRFPRIMICLGLGWQIQINKAFAQFVRLYPVVRKRGSSMIRDSFVVLIGQRKPEGAAVDQPLPASNWRILAQIQHDGA